LLWLFIVLAGAVIGLVYGYMVCRLRGLDEIMARSLAAARAGALITGFSGAFELFVYKEPAGAWLRRKPFLVAFVSRLLIHACLIVIAILINRGLNYFFFGNVYILAQSRLDALVHFAFALSVVGGIAFLLEFRALIGARAFSSIVLGRYHRPQQERRIFLFIDLRDSTRLAAKIGDRRYQALVARVFFDLDEIVVDHGGEVHAYVGDLMIATWPLADSRKNARAVAAVLAMQDRIAARAPDYEREFGATPGIWACLHGGEIVAGEYGSSKRQISYFGDAINTTARMKTAAKSLDQTFVISKLLLDQTDLPQALTVVGPSEHALAGIGRPLTICSVSRA
jgi:class 3 adenylate cyclase